MSSPARERDEKEMRKTLVILVEEKRYKYAIR
jgi:hypothetical protein